MGLFRWLLVSSEIKRGENVDTRQALGFQEFADKFFDYLGDGYGFKKTSSDVYCVQFDSKDRYVKIVHGRNEIDLFIGHKTVGKEIRINDVIQYSGCMVNQWAWNASTRHSVEEGSRRLAQLLKDVGGEALTGSVEYFEDVYNMSTQLQYAVEKQQELADMEERAHEAWIKKDYKRVVVNYESYENLLNEVQQKRLELARRKI